MDSSMQCPIGELCAGGGPPRSPRLVLGCFRASPLPTDCSSVSFSSLLDVNLRVYDFSGWFPFP